ncbi:MAG: glycosyltransferase family 4 protein [Nostocales cyanobacterium 94392]|nr:glycosyltransferase family 4 protein [Nostocales cyanobacterium 94392]
MKILHLSTGDIDGGAFRGAYWLHQGLIEAGCDSKMLVSRKKSDDFTVIAPENKLYHLINILISRLDRIPLLFYKNRTYNSFSHSWISSKINQQVQNCNPDIINLHWINGGFVKPESLVNFRKPIVWTLRDEWPFTGGCHYAGDCIKYKNSCGTCPQLGSHIENDISKKLWHRKQKAWQNLDITVVAISHWLAKCARESSLFKDKIIEVIPNALDELKFKPIDKKIAREILNIPQNKKIILFGALDAIKNERKGFQYLIPALQKLSNNGFGESTELLIFGSSQPKEPPNLGMKSHYMGKLHDDTTLALTYAAADVTVTPSIEEAFGKTAMESLACGTPVVSFDSTGLKDIVEHEENGYRAKLFSSDDLANGIAWILKDEQRWQALSRQGREKVEQEFTLKKQAEAYLKIYSQLLK